MQSKDYTDCEVAAIATSTGKTYKESQKALSWRDLWSWLENPFFGNPWNVYLALMRLGFWKKNITLTMLLSGEAEPMKTIVLVHDPKNPFLAQHWVVWGGITAAGNHMLFWGDDIRPRLKSDDELKNLFKNGWPNCAFQVYKANVFELWKEKVKILANNFIKKLTSWYDNLIK